MNRPPDIGAAPTDWSLIKRVWPYVKPVWPFYVTALVLAPFSAVVAILQPWLLKVAIDDHIMKGDAQGLQWIALAFLGLAVASWVIEASYMLAVANGAMRTITLLRTHIFQHTMSLSRSFFDRQPVGRLMTRATSDVEALGETLTAGSVTIFLDILKVVGIIAAMLYLDPWLTLVMLVISPLVFIVLETIRKILRRLYLEVRTSLSELNAFTAERLNGLEIVQLYGDEGRAKRMYNQRVLRYRNAAIQTNIYDAALYAIMGGLRAITMALMLWYGSGGLLGGVVTAGLLAAFIEYVDRLYQPIQEFSAKIAIIQRATAALEKIFGLLGLTEQVEEGSVELDRQNLHITVEDLYFSYLQGTDIIKGISLDVKPGAVVAIVGRTGSGKTTLGRLLTRDYDGYRGSIKVGEYELYDVSIQSLRSTVHTVRQDVELFADTVRFNVALGAERTDEQLWEAIRLAQAEEVVQQLGGLDGKLMNKGSNLSVGEGQLLAIARVMVHDAPIVILDEATANVDSITESRIQKATAALLERKTVLVIAHRLSTIIHADAIILMDGGTVLESGTHAQLMENEGPYADLFQRQFTSLTVKAEG